MSPISIVIPIFNEMKNDLFKQSLSQLMQMPNVELVIADGGSIDGTREYLEKLNVKLVSTEGTSRACRINHGIQEAQYEQILLHHPRSVIDTNAIEYLQKESLKNKWGGLTHKFDLKHPLLEFTSWYSNTQRSKRQGIIYLDHCFYFQKSMFEAIAPLPSVDIFEDTILSKRLTSAFGKPTVLPFISQTSAIRFETNGILKQCLMNQYLKLRFFLGSDHKRMNRLYEKNNSLNTDYK